MEHQYGKYYSWIVESETIAYKKCDKSFFKHNGSGVPSDICWFFDADNLENGKRIEIILKYDNAEFSGHVERESNKLGRFRIFWQTKLGTIFDEVYGQEENILAKFEKVSEKYYIISFVDAANNKDNDEWVISGNPKRYDCINAFKELKKVDWKQNTNVKVGDIVYLYISNPEQNIRVKCKANKVDLEKPDIDDTKYDLTGEFDGSYGRYMELEMIDEFNTPLLSRNSMTNYGFTPPQKAIKVSGELKTYLDLVQYLLNVDEMDPNVHDGSYKLVQETIKEYSKMKDLSLIDYKDLNLVYLMTIGTWKQKIESKENTIKESHLPDESKEYLVNLIRETWENAKNFKYENEEKGKPSIGMFGTGFFTFKNKTDEKSPKNFIHMCIDIMNMTDDEEIFNRCEKTLNSDYKGMRAASASVILHCLKPYVFPIFNSNMGAKNIFEYLGLNLKNKSDVKFYIENTRLVKKFRDDNFNAKNYRIYDMAAWRIEKSNNSLTVYKNLEKKGYLPTLDEYNPGFDKNEWLEILYDKQITSEKAINMLNTFYRNGGEGSCVELEEKYGETADYYRMVAVHMADKIIKIKGCVKPELAEITKLWPVLFVGRNAKGNERGSFIWKLRPELYEALSEFTFDEPDEGGAAEMTNKEIIEQVKHYIAAKGFSYDDGLIENFYLSLKSKPFVILAGTSGTGKTRLVRLFAEAIGANAANGRYKLVAVRPDWSDSSDLFGHVDLNGNFIPGAITKFVEEAASDKDNPYFLCLDEMNLARVEYYLSDILSIMETRDYREGEIVTDDILLEGHDALTLSENLYIIGTVNMDETTFPFSKKVLDRANTIEFSYVDLLPEFNKSTESVDIVEVNNSFLKTEYLYLMNCNDDEKSKAKDICVTLQEINEILKIANAHVGYRVRDEIVFYMFNNDNTDLLSEQDALDNEILQKILPRIQGSSSAIREMICDLFMYCVGEYDGYRTDSGDISKKMMIALDEKNAKYPKSAEKLAYMMRRYEEDGFTAYWQ